MPIYSKVISDDCILNMLNPSYKNITIIGCGGCMNESLAFTNSKPLIVHGKKDSFPPIESECARIANLLNKYDYNTKIIIMPPGSNSGCIRDLNNSLFDFSISKKTDVILVLSCPAGFWGLSQSIKGIPLISLTKQIGMIYYTYDDNKYECTIVNCKLAKFT